MAILEFDIPVHRDYAGSAEQLAGDPPNPDQDWTPADINLLRDVLANHGVNLGLMGDLTTLTTTETATLVGAINSLILDTSTGTAETWSAAKIIDYVSNISIDTSAITALQTAVDGINTSIATINGNIGTLANLQTTAKASLVDAINEARQSGGGETGASIDDAATTAVSTWSSTKISAEIAAVDTKADTAITDAATADAKAVTAQTAADAAQADATTGIANAATAQSAADAAQTDATTAITNAATAQTAADAAQADATTAITNAGIAQATADANALLLDARQYSALATTSQTINATIVGSQIRYHQAFDTTAAELTATIANDVVENTEIVINRATGANNVLVDAGADIAMPDGQLASPLALNEIGQVLLKKYAAGWRVLEINRT